MREQLARAAGRLFLGKPFTDALRNMQEAQWLRNEDVAPRTEARLASILEHTRTTVPFYRSRVNAARMSLDAFPVLTKSDFRAAGVDALMSEDVPPHRRLARTTSGSTGDPFRFYIDRAALPVVFASHVFYDQLCGLEPGDRYIRLVAPTSADEIGDGAPAPVRIRRMFVRWLQQKYENRTQRRAWLVAVDPEAAQRFRAEVEAFRPAFILGYTSTLAAVAAELLRSSRPLTSRLRGVITIAELLTPERRRVIERYFEAPITNRYGLREFGWWAGQSCSSSGDSVHLNTELAAWEIVRDDGSPASAGEIGRLVLTDLHNRAMPLIRYDTGDLAVAEPASCACGRSFPLVTIAGRAHECLRLPSGRTVTPRELARALVDDLDDCGQYQLVHDPQNGARLVVAPGRAREETTARLQDTLEALVAGELNVSIESADQIPLERSGKRPIVKAQTRGEDG